MSGLATYFADQADLLAIDIRVLNVLLKSKHPQPATLVTVLMARQSLAVARDYLLQAAASELPLTKESAK